MSIYESILARGPDEVLDTLAAQGYRAPWSSSATPTRSGRPWSATTRGRSSPAPATASHSTARPSFRPARKY